MKIRKKSARKARQTIAWGIVQKSGTLDKLSFSNRQDAWSNSFDGERVARVKITEV